METTTFTVGLNYPECMSHIEVEQVVRVYMEAGSRAVREYLEDSGYTIVKVECNYPIN